MKAVLITGASGGIGQALCLAFREAGYRVIGTDLEIPPDDVDVFVPADLEALVRDETSADEILDQLKSVLEGDRLDVLINNAALQIVKPSESLNLRDWRRTLDTNVIAPFALIRGLLPQLTRAHGCVVNIASVHARLTKPGFVAYATSKHALVGLTKSLAVDLAGAVRVNCINPAATATPMLIAGFEGRDAALADLAGMHPSGRIAEPMEVARAAIFLASEAASFINGAALDVDGAIGARLHDPE